tara:strand:- start:268 stop:696 length:429 start_codon:yes stop_codon:yes gene_type:complete
MKTLATFAFAFLLCACTTTPNNQFGNYVNQDSENHLVASIAADTAIRLSSNFLPSKTKFYFNHANNDFFGSVLTEQLRELGFAVAEFNVDSGKDGERLAYILDKYDDSKVLIRVYAGSTTYSRLYAIEQNIAQPYGAWSKME